MNYELEPEVMEGLDTPGKGAELPQPEPMKPVGPAGGEAGETGEALGYSSEYYKHQMESAIASGNKIAYENARRAYSRAVVRESYGTSGEETGEIPAETGETGEAPGEALGYSSEYYKHQMASALSSGNKIAYKNNLNAYSKAVVRESLGAGHLQKEMKEAVKAAELGGKETSQRLMEAAQLKGDRPLGAETPEKQPKEKGE